jgi:hypothetical protein
MSDIKQRQNWIVCNGLSFFLLISLSLILLSGCGPIDFQAGRSFDSGSLESVLMPGVSKATQIEAVLGKPFGKGRALMPYHEEPRTVWTYFFEQGSINLGGGESKDKRKYLFVYFAEDTLDGYMWFESNLSSHIR